MNRTRPVAVLSIGKFMITIVRRTDAVYALILTTVDHIINRQFGRCCYIWHFGTDDSLMSALEHVKNQIDIFDRHGGWNVFTVAMRSCPEVQQNVEELAGLLALDRSTEHE